MKLRGVYYLDSNTIILDLWKSNGKFLSINDILITLAHEMAHAATWDGKGDCHCLIWKKKFREIWKYIREKYL